jgi:uncharacterized protein (TIGR03067 family)
MLKSGCATLTREAAMRTRLAGLVLLGMTLVSAGVAVGGDAKADLKKFAGTWAVESATKEGKDAPAGEVKDITFTFTGDKVTIRRDGMEVECAFKIDPSKKPAHIDLTIVDTSAPGIYAFEKGKLKLCVNNGGGKRPTEFKSAEGSKTSLLVLKRVKK